MINTFLNNYFGFNRQQRNGLLLLIGISFFLLIVRLVYPYFIRPDDMIIRNLNVVTAAADGLEHDIKHQSNTASTTLRNFDPNTVTYEELLAMGFSARTAKTLQTFRKKGFKFSKKEDLLKVYGISDSFYAEIEPYISISNVSASSREVSSKSHPATVQNASKVELNSADSVTLLKVNGIGPAFAKRILKYREILGGYVNIEQLKEVYGLTEEHYQKMKNGVSVNAALVRKINVNRDDFKIINKHPYISYEQTKLICNYRQKTPISQANIGTVLNDDTLTIRLMPYLAFN